MGRFSDILNNKNAGGTPAPGTGRFSAVLDKQEQTAPTQTVSTGRFSSILTGGAPVVSEQTKAPSVPSRTSGNVLDELNAVKAEADRRIGTDFDSALSSAYDALVAKQDAGEDFAEELKAYQTAYDDYYGYFNEKNLDRLLKEAEKQRDAKANDPAWRKAVVDLERNLYAEDASVYKEAVDKHQKELDEIKAWEQTLRQDKQSAKYIQYMSMAGKDDFEKYSKQKTWLNDYVKELDGHHGDAAAQLSEDELAVYNYLYNKEGRKKADEYYEFLKGFALTERQGVAKANHIQGLGGFEKTVAGLGTNAWAGVQDWWGGTKSWFTGDTEQSAGQIAAQILTEESGPVASVAYQGARVLGNMAPSILLSKGTGAVAGKMGASAATAAKVGQTASRLSMFNSIAGNSYAQKIREGWEEKDARLFGALMGASEIATEAIFNGIPGLGGAIDADDFVRTLNGSFSRLVVGGVINSVGEIAEEGLQMLIEPAIEQYFVGGDYKAPTGKEALDVALVTTIATAAMNAPHSIGLEIDYNKYGKMVQQQHGWKELADRAQKLGAGTTSAKIAEKISAEPYNVSYSDIGRLYTQMHQDGILKNGKFVDKTAPTTPTDTTPTAQTEQAEGTPMAEHTAQPADTTAPEAAAERLQTQEATAMPTPENAPQTTQEAAPDVMTQEAQRLFGKNETAASEETTVNMGIPEYQKAEHHGNILDGIRNGMEQIRDMAAVKTLTGSEFQKTDTDTRNLRTRVIEFFNSLGNHVTRIGFGDIALNSAGVRDSLGHGYGKLKAATFAALPDVLRSGKIVGYNKNYENRGYESFLIAAPVTVGNERCYVGALVIKDAGTQRYKVHEVLTTTENGTPSFKTEALETEGLLRDGAPFGNPTQLSSEEGATVPAPIIPNGEANGNPENFGNTVGAAEMGFSPFSHAELEYGTMDGGENAVRPDDMPVSTDGINRVSRTAVTVKGAKVTPEDFVPLLERRVMDTNKNTGLRYIPITNDATTQAAMDDISESGWDDALRDWTSDVRGGKVSAELTAKGAILYNHAVNSGNKKLALDILSDYAANVRSAAQGLQAARILKTLTPDDSLYMIQKSIDRMVKDMNLPEGIKISEDLKEAYRNAENQETRNEVLGFMQQEVARQLSATTADKWRAWRMVSMLGTFKGPLRNITSNVLTGTMYRAKNALRAGIEKLFRGKFGRTSSAFISKELMDAGRQDFAANKDTIVDGSRHGEAFSTDSFLRGAQEQMQIFDFTPLEGARRLTNYALNNKRFGDEAFMRNAYARYLGGWLKANGITAENWNSDQWQEQNGETAAAARAFAKQQAQEATLRDHNELSDIAAKAGRGANKGIAAKFLSVIGEALMPFRRTPTTALVRMEQYSPLGIANAVANAVMARKGQTNSRGETVTSQDVLESICKALTGSGVMLLGGLLARAGFLRGSEDEDEKQAQFDELTGQQESAIYLRDGTNITIDWAAPATAPLLIGAELEKIRQEGGWSWSEFFDTLLSISDPLLETSMLSGLNKAIDDVKYSDHPIPDLAIALTMDFFGQGVSTLAGQVSRSFREDSTMTYVDKESPLPSIVQKGLGEVSRKLPGPGYNQVPYIDAWGRTENIGETLAGRFVNNVFNPAFVDKAEKDATETELQRLYDSKIDKDGLRILPTRAAKYFTMDGKTVNLTAEQYVEYATAKGQLSKQYIEAAMATPEYQRMDDQDKAKYVSKMYDLANYHAKQKLFPDYTSKNYKSYDTWTARGLTPAKSYLLIADWQ